MIMQEPAPESQNVQEEEERLARAYLALVDRGQQQKRATPVAKRKESEAHYSDALDAATDQDEYELLLLATYTDPANAAALFDLKDFFDLTLEEEIIATRAIVAIAEKRIGKKGFKDCAGHFWSFLETRPYMMARAELGDLLGEADRTDLAVAEWEALLALNPNDDQELRHVLLTAYLRDGQLDKVGGLFAQYPDDVCGCAHFAWCRVLERLLQKDEGGAAAALAAARASNGFAEAFLLGHRQPAKEVPETYAPGSREEAAYFSGALLQAWGSHPEAAKWLASQPKSRK